MLKMVNDAIKSKSSGLLKLCLGAYNIHSGLHIASISTIFKKIIYLSMNRLSLDLSVFIKVPVLKNLHKSK